ncbi:alpha/beta hydrolase [Pedobacter changchengzhani]|uniref:Alpha/beta hydrolase n=1 Tax=Pedobacter changchengzhani TaxID=2529274 RepID=A0A4R5MQG8_9SPHI|nr:alpha/beta hydrolase [Pedobacter changchengzhani]TDG37998.1 alpha/beta hydrolase [Pedobacter changchengzhani]
MIKSFLVTAFCMGIINVNAQKIIPIYPAEIPGAKPTPATYVETTVTRANGTLSVTKVSIPTLTVFKAPKEKANGTAVIICPGGGYSSLAFSHEGLDVAKRFNEIGITAFVLKYRLPNDEIMVDKTYGPLQDAQQAIYLIRKHAKKYGIKKNKIGILGFSAGGHLVATLLTHYGDLKIADEEKISLRPDFGVLLYPVVSFKEFVHEGTMDNLLGKTPSDEMKTYFSANRNVTKNTPPVFFVHAKDDKTVPVENSILMNEALKRYGVDTDIYLYEAGGHGFGLKNKTSDVDWFGLMATWLMKNKF